MHNVNTNLLKIVRVKLSGSQHTNPSFHNVLQMREQKVDHIFHKRNILAPCCCFCRLGSGSDKVKVPGSSFGEAFLLFTGTLKSSDIITSSVLIKGIGGRET